MLELKILDSELSLFGIEKRGEARKVAAGAEEGEGKRNCSPPMIGGALMAMLLRVRMKEGVN